MYFSGLFAFQCWCFSGQVKYFIIDFLGFYCMVGSLEDLSTYAIIFKGAISFPEEMSSIEAQTEIVRRVYNHSPSKAKDFFFHLAFGENIPLLEILSQIYPEFLPMFCDSYLMTLILNNKNKVFPIVFKNVRDLHDVYNFYGNSKEWRKGLIELSRIVPLKNSLEHSYIQKFVQRYQ